MADTSEQNKNSESGQSFSQPLHNVRYCEVIPVTRKRAKLTSWVYNTTGLNLCPAAEWDALTEEQVNEEYGSVAAKLNGPRYWVMDRLVASGSSTTDMKFTFGGIEMELRATLETGLREGTVGEEFYAPNQVERDTIYTYNAGRTVYELTSPEPERHVYLMQSYAQIKDKNLTLDDLASLGDRLALPDGWTYTTRTLTEELLLDSGGLAYVVNDDFYNSYQRRT
jgi:hypothetical protein